MVNHKEEDGNLSTVISPEKPCWHISDLLKGQQEAIVLHAGDEYRLRLTKNNKLILTK